jgi:hypothetical protein
MDVADLVEFQPHVSQRIRCFALTTVKALRSSCIFWRFAYHKFEFDIPTSVGCRRASNWFFSPMTANSTESRSGAER